MPYRNKLSTIIMFFYYIYRVDAFRVFHPFDSYFMNFLLMYTPFNNTCVRFAVSVQFAHDFRFSNNIFIYNATYEVTILFIYTRQNRCRVDFRTNVLA